MGTEYLLTYKVCENVSSFPDSNVTISCTAILNDSSQINTSANYPPSYLIISKYVFKNASAAKFFLDSLASDLNTSPWNDNIPNFNYSDGLVYTTVVYPNYKGTNIAAEVLAIYKQYNNVVLSVSTSNMTNNANILEMKNYSSYLIFKYYRQIENTLS
ncbi:MAG: hypothetical protein ACP5TI_06415, partial [Thermoprotei archaeon]